VPQLVQNFAVAVFGAAQFWHTCPRRSADSETRRLMAAAPITKASALS
jgi:hypothetical protein